MLKDITLGQYFPGDTVIHKLDPRTKLILVIVFIVALFLAATSNARRRGNPLIGFPAGTLGVCPILTAAVRRP